MQKQKITEEQMAKITGGATQNLCKEDFESLDPEGQYLFFNTKTMTSCQGRPKHLVEHMKSDKTETIEKDLVNWLVIAGN